MLRGLVERDCPKSHVEIQGCTVSKTFKSFEKIMNAWHWIWTANDPTIELTEVGDEANLSIFLGRPKGRRGPFTFVASAKDFKAAEAIDFVANHGFVSFGN